MSKQTRNQVGQYEPIPMSEKPNPALQLIAWSIWVTYRTLVLIRVLAPRYIRRSWRIAKELGFYLRLDAQVAGVVYAGGSVTWIDPKNEGTALVINNYHTRYEGTERAAAGEEL